MLTPAQRMRRAEISKKKVKKKSITFPVMSRHNSENAVT